MCPLATSSDASHESFTVEQTCGCLQPWCLTRSVNLDSLSQLQVSDSNAVSAGPKAESFSLVQAFQKSQEVWESQGFSAAKNRDDLVAKLDSAIADSGKGINLGL